MKHILEIVQSIATIIALLAGAIWALYIYIDQREAKPQLNINHQIKSLLLNPEYRLIHITVIHENRGNTLIKLNQADIRLQRVMPLPRNVSDKLKNLNNPIRKNELVIRWPLLCRRLLKHTLELEPNETHESINEFVVPSYVKIIRIYTYYPNEEKNSIGWAKATIYNVENEEKRDEIQPRKDNISPDICTRNVESSPN